MRWYDMRVYIYRYIHIYIYTQCLGSRAARPPTAPPWYPPPGPHSQGCLQQQSQGSVWLGPRPRDSPRCRRMGSATSHLDHGIRSWHDVVLGMIVFVLAGAGCKTRFAPEHNPPAKPQGGGGDGYNYTNAPRAHQSDGCTTAT